jgi:alkylation response protein AidB-like acyl-CoA dehydrogenase
VPNFIVQERDQRFLLFEVLNVQSLFSHPKFSEFSEDVASMVLDEAQKVATEVIYPTLSTGDKEGCRLENGQVYVPKAFHACYRAYCEAAWNSVDISKEAGGQGFPRILGAAAREWFSHNFAFLSYPDLTQGAAHLIERFGSEEQKSKYLPSMVSGKWAGTMCLTEPQAGSDVGALTTKAIRQPDGTFRIKGTKVFITGGDHDLTENIIHPVLARIEGDPAGTKGISLFLVPKFLVNKDGTLGRRNDFEIGKIEEKLGIHGSSTCLINFGDNGECYAELLGNEREGMKIMFLMMNGARLSVGMQGVASASAAYLHALQYAKERLQGTSIERFKDPTATRVPIIEHPDVRRMLMWMKSHAEAIRALLYFTYFCLDKWETAASEEEGESWRGLVEILTPVCKAFASEAGFQVADMAVQVYGGAGYTQDYLAEQLLRDSRIAPIYEGTNGIQALDLVGRKLAMKSGAYFRGLLEHMGQSLGEFEETPATAEIAKAVRKALGRIEESAFIFMQASAEGRLVVPLSYAHPFLRMFGTVVCAWLLTWEAAVAAKKLEEARSAGKTLEVGEDKEAAFYQGKLLSARYFATNVLPQAEALFQGIQSQDLSMVEMHEESFA